MAIDRTNTGMVGGASRGWTIANHPFSFSYRFWGWDRGSYAVRGIPLWLIAPAVALVTARLWIRNRTRPGQCPTCLYDLSGLVSPAIACPECGAAIDPASLQQQPPAT